LQVERLCAGLRGWGMPAWLTMKAYTKKCGVIYSARLQAARAFTQHGASVDEGGGEQILCE